MAVATVGSTSFSLLIEAVLSPASLHALAAHGITSLLVQHGTVPPRLGPWLRPLKLSSQYTFIDAPSLTVTLQPFVAEIDELLGRARIAITHAGLLLYIFTASFV
ncbi:hypothetical protein CROQUDRAFT_664750 [Cronartium quercuum f. sp. fusiforme G11]|uniref:UDP-N-acetylglucosamine transferase subunit ALG13 n=1 Tax=Cronartium quercuum f. sp. fusiforme G11 TaxID=708437 RepID=A0A9P6NAN8_9BASI|nr:hypothetical protein CROQUDRAFT_664750 [Cronartium quercuum f. sp. fusiforme G11]